MQICNHPALSYWPVYEYDRAALVHNCGKFRMLDRLLVKLHAGGHRVLLFSTMTKLLDLLEEYLKWRQIEPDGQRMGYLRIDGSTSLEDRSAAIALNFQHALIHSQHVWVMDVAGEWHCWPCQWAHVSCPSITVCTSVGERFCVVDGVGRYAASFREQYPCKKFA